MTATRGGRSVDAWLASNIRSPLEIVTNASLSPAAARRIEDSRVRSLVGACGLRRQLVPLVVSVGWPRDWDLHLDEGSASGRALDLDAPSERLDSIPQPGQSGPSAGVRAAHTVIANRKTEHVLVETEGDPHARGVRVLRRVGERLRDGVVGGYLDVVREPLLEAHVELDPH